MAMFALSLMPLALTMDAQAMNVVKLTQEIDPTMADLADAAFAQLPDSSAESAIVVKAKPVPQPKNYFLKIEIDYIDGHEPTPDVLNYMISYYAARSVTLQIVVDDKISLSAGYADGVSDDEFSALEAAHNEGTDELVDDTNYAEYMLPEKWVLFGTTVEGSTNVVGYTYCVGTFRDLVAGNFIYIADGAADDWAGDVGVSAVGAEAVLLMHEFGHAIGICVVRAGSEVYCSDYYCVMSYLRTQNSGNIDLWYYCSSHWKTKNLDYYVA